MRDVITFAVVGSDRAELHEKATETYRRLMGDEKAEIPHGATIEISPEQTAEAGSGEVIATVWEGRVTLTLTSEDGPTR
jgi:hypothetical protein